MYLIHHLLLILSLGVLLVLVRIYFCVLITALIWGSLGKMLIRWLIYTFVRMTLFSSSHQVYHDIPLCIISDFIMNERHGLENWLDQETIRYHVCMVHCRNRLVSKSVATGQTGLELVRTSQKSDVGTGLNRPKTGDQLKLKN